VSASAAEPAQSEAAPAAPDDPASIPAGRGAWLVLAAVLPGMFINIFDFFVVNVATPVLHRDLGSGPPALELIVGGYGLTFSLGLVTGGRLGDRYGRRRVFFAGMAAFTLTSVASGLAPTSDILVVSRLLQGAAAALMVPQVLSIIRVSFPPRERRIALGVYGMTIAAGQVSGQALGGLLLSANIAGLGWRPIFLVNVPVAALAFGLGFRRVPESRSPTRPSLDLPGVALLTLAAGLLVIPVVEGGALGWPLWCWLSLAAVPAAGAAFVGWERRARVTRQPLVDLALIASKDFRRGLFVNLTLYATITSFFFVLGLYLQAGRGDTPLVAGLTFVPLAAGNFVASLSSSSLVGRFGRSTLSAGAVLQVAALLMLLVATAPGRPAVLLLGAVAVFGLGQGLLIPPIIGVVLSRVPVADSGAAAGVLVTVQQMSGTIGLALVSLGFFAGVGAGQAGGYVSGFRIACVCDVLLALGTLLLTRLLAPPERPRLAGPSSGRLTPPGGPLQAVSPPTGPRAGPRRPPGAPPAARRWPVPVPCAPPAVRPSASPGSGAWSTAGTSPART
jgi:EmrB/QacA subfamily drug resistance transporter